MPDKCKMVDAREQRWERRKAQGRVCGRVQPMVRHQRGRSSICRRRHEGTKLRSQTWRFGFRDRSSFFRHWAEVSKCPRVLPLCGLVEWLKLGFWVLCVHFVCMTSAELSNWSPICYGHTPVRTGEPHNICRLHKFCVIVMHGCLHCYDEWTQ